MSYICDFKLSSSHIFQKKLISVMYFTSPNIPKILCEHSSFNVKLKLLILHCVHAKSSQSRVYFTVQHTSLNSDWPHFKCSVQLGHISSGYQLGSAHLLSQKVKIDLREERTFEPSLEGWVGFWYTKRREEEDRRERTEDGVNKGADQLHWAEARGWGGC